METGLGVVAICDALKDYLAALFPTVSVVRGYLETFDWDSDGVAIVVSPESAEVEPKSHGLYKRTVDASVLVYKNLDDLDVSATNEELDGLLGLLDEIAVAFTERVKIVESEEVYSVRVLLPSGGLYDADALSSGRFVGGLIVELEESFAR